eukprot:jgi/Orpsp1_1/1185457/evm.model.c7180000093862.1
MEDFNNKLNIEELITHNINDLNIDDVILHNANVEDENPFYSYDKLEASEMEDRPQTNNYLKIECSFAKHYNGIGQNVKAYVTIINDCFEELNNIKCIISSENYFNTYSFIINSIQINEVIVKEINLTICDKYLNLEKYNISFDNSTLIDNLIDNLPNNINIKLINENQNFSKNFMGNLKLLFENYSSSKIDFTDDETTKRSFIEQYMNNEKWPLNIRIFYNKNFNHINQNHKENKEILNYIINGYFPNDNSIVHLTEKNMCTYNKTWNEIETYHLDENIENMKAYYLFNNGLPKNSKQYINAIIILLPVIANSDLEILENYKELADTLSKQGRPVYFVLDNFINKFTSESSLTDVDDSKEDINFMNIVNEFSLYPIFTTSSYELINTNNNNEDEYNVISIQRFRKNINRDILLLHMMNKMTKDLIDINLNQKMLINPESENLDILVILYWNKDYDQDLNLIPTIIGECYSTSNNNRMALISNINQRFNIDFTSNRLDYFKELSMIDINNMKYENTDFKEVISKADYLLTKTENNNCWNTWIITNEEISSSDINIIESKLTKKAGDKIYFININEKQNCYNNIERDTSCFNRYLTVENIDSLIEYFANNTKKNNNLIINPKLTLNIIKQYSIDNEINVNYTSENINSYLMKYDFRIPSSISLVKNISKISLSNCKLRGTIPEALNNLINLNELHLNFNRLEGRIPEFIGNLKSLTILHLDNNMLEGRLPLSIGNLSSLKELYLDNNYLSGQIPETIGNLKELIILQMENNRFNGEIPLSLFNLSNLVELYLSDNELIGNIRENIESLSKIEVLKLDKNMLTGNIPESIGNLSNLKRLYLNQNHFTGAVPKSIGNLKNLRRLWLNNNSLNQVIPNEICQLIELKKLRLDHNEFIGGIPENIGNLINLRVIGLNNNKLTGCIPSSVGNLKNLYL